MAEPSDPPEAPGTAAAPGGPLAPGSVSLRLYAHEGDPVSALKTLRAQARQAEEAGYDGVMVSEHHAGFAGYLPNPVQLAGVLLDAMRTAWAAPCPMLPALKPVGLVVEDLAWLAAAHPGRVAAGFAAGAWPEDFEVAEVPFAEAVPRFKAALPGAVAALRGQAAGPLAADPALQRLAEHPIPLALAAQSTAAAQRAARLGCAVLYDSLTSPANLARLSKAHREAGAATGRVLIRRVWIGNPPEPEMAAQMRHYRSYAPQAATSRWAEDSLISAATPAAAADALADAAEEADCDILNIRVHAKGVSPARVGTQIGMHGQGFLERLRERLAARPRP